MTAPDDDAVPSDASGQGSARVAELLRELLAVVDADEVSATPAERGVIAGALAACESGLLLR